MMLKTMLKTRENRFHKLWIHNLHIIYMKMYRTLNPFCKIHPYMFINGF